MRQQWWLGWPLSLLVGYFLGYNHGGGGGNDAAQRASIHSAGECNPIPTHTPVYYNIQVGVSYFRIGINILDTMHLPTCV